MAKYYCQNNQFKTIVDAPSPLAAVEKTLRKIMNDEEVLGLLMIIGERGFSYKQDNLLVPVIPVLKQMNVIDEDIDLEKLICESLKIKRKDISDKEINWLITGRLEEGEGDVAKD
jgi:hypothetical protein